MARTKGYRWGDQDGAVLGEHSKRKHKILREYFRRYILERCKSPISGQLKLVVVDGFCGGVYAGNEQGSAMIFLETLVETVCEINISRKDRGYRPLLANCLLLFNDKDPAAIASLVPAVAPLQVRAREQGGLINIDIQFSTKAFEEFLPECLKIVSAFKCQNIIYNLDQCGNSLVRPSILAKLMANHRSVEIFLNYSIQSFYSFLQQNDPEALKKQLRALEVDPAHVDALDLVVSKDEFMGMMEKMAFDVFRGSAPFVSPFSIHNPDGWHYWYLHFAKSDRARQVYNDVLHDNSSHLAHYGRAGLRMLTYTPKDQAASLHLFDASSRSQARASLPDDIARFVSECGDIMPMSEFLLAAYNETQAHSEDIYSAIIDSDDLEVLTEAGNERRSAKTISRDDTLRLKRQMSFYIGWPRQARRDG